MMTRYCYLTGLVCILHFVSIQCAGMTSHNIAAKRSSQYEYFGPQTEEFDPQSFYGLAHDRKDAIQAGAPFPDYLYLCGDSHDAGEEAHWTPFQMAAADYIRSTYPNWYNESRSADGPGLVAFMLGVTSHYIVDINWHGLETIPSGEGLIRTMGYADFFCTDGDLCGVAHSACDTGGEFVGAATLNISWYPDDTWYVPVDDLVNIYALLNASGEGPLVEPEWIEECGVIFYIGSWAVSTFGDIIYPLLAPTLGSVLFDNYMDFQVGGIDDDAAWTSFMWNRFAEWVVYGPPDTPPPRTLQQQEQQQQQQAEDARLPLLSMKQRKKWIQSLRDILRYENVGEVFGVWRDSPHDSSRYSHSNGRHIGMFPSIDKLPLTNELRKTRIDVFNKIADSLADVYVASLLSPLAEFFSQDIETTLHKLKSDFYLRVIEIVDGSSLSSAVDFTAIDQSVREFARGSVAHEYFGSSITVGNFLARKSPTSGLQDILIGAPGVGVAGGPQQGVAKLYGAGTNTSTIPSVVFYGGGGLGLRNGDSPDEPSYERFGWSSATLDINGDNLDDMVVCAPSFGGKNVEEVKGNYSGRCDIYYGPFVEYAPIPYTPDVSIYGDKDWGAFGYSIAAGDIDGDSKADLVISAPFAGSYTDLNSNDRGDLSSQGAVYVFYASSFPNIFNSNVKAVYAHASADVTLQPDASFQWFGKSILIVPASQYLSESLLLVGAPVFHPLRSSESDVETNVNSAVGRIYAYSLTQSKEEHIWSLTGSAHAGRTGQTMASSGDLFAFSEPSFNGTKSEDGKLASIRDDKILRAGRVITVSLSALHATLSLRETKDMLVSELPQALNGVYWESRGDSFEGRYGSTLQFFDDSTLLVGSPLAEYGSGRVTKVEVSSGRVVWTVKGDQVNGVRSKGRFGSALAIVRNDRGVDEVIVGSPYYGLWEENEQLGAVHVISKVH